MNEEILKAIKESDVIIIERHQRPDPDALGSQMGLRSTLRATYPDKEVYAVGQDEPSLSYFGQMDQVPDDAFRKATVIVNDTANTERIDDDRYQQAKLLIKVDHHPNNEPYGDLEYVDPEAAAASEIWAETVLDDHNELVMTDEAAKYFYLGIVGDTGRFLYDNTSPKTMHIAGDLMTYDFPASEILQSSNTQSFAQAKLQGYVLENMEMTEDGLVSWVYLSQDLLKTLGLSEAETHNIVQLPGSITGVQAWVIFIEQPDGKTARCRIRSKGPSINGIAEAHDGGGHAKASGANAKDKEEREKIIQELDQASQTYVQSRA